MVSTLSLLNLMESRVTELLEPITFLPLFIFSVLEELFYRAWSRLLESAQLLDIRGEGGVGMGGVDDIGTNFGS